MNAAGDVRVGLVVDSACDLPESFLQDHHVEVLPINIRVDGDLVVDRHDAAAALEFYRHHIGDKGHDAESVPYSTEQIRELFMGRLVTEFDFVFCQTIMRSRSPIYENATKASFSILSEYYPARQAAGVEGPFALRVLNTGTLFAGQGVLAAETLRMIREGVNANDIRQRLEHLVDCVRAYAIPPDLYYLRARARKKGDRSVSLIGAALGTALDVKPILCGYADQTHQVDKVRGFGAAVKRLFEYAGKRVREGLLSPYLVISYAGDLDTLRSLPGYSELQQQCREARIELLCCVMSVTGGVNLGPGAVSLGLLAEPHAFD